MEFIIPILTMAILGFLFALGLAIAYQKLKVQEDPKVVKISEILPQANCGACGFSGCRAYAEAVVKGDAPPNGCPVGGQDVAAQVAEILGVQAGEMTKKVARVHCRGTIDAAPNRGLYNGIESCAAAQLVGGNKVCSYGCLGYGDCVQACLFDAIHVAASGLPVVDEEKCTACGKCVDACPRNILELLPASQEILVFCRSEERGPAAKKACKNACIGCGICVRACPEAIVLENNLAKIIDANKIEPENIPAIEKCPTNSIGRISNNDQR